MKLDRTSVAGQLLTACSCEEVAVRSGRHITMTSSPSTSSAILGGDPTTCPSAVSTTTSDGPRETTRPCSVLAVPTKLATYGVAGRL